MNKGYREERLSFLRRAVIASASASKRRNMIHGVTEVDITVPRRHIARLKAGGHDVSFTAYVVACLAASLRRHPRLNSYIRGRRLVIMDTLTVSVLVERELEGVSVPEPLPLTDCWNLDCLAITERIRGAQKVRPSDLGSLSGIGWIRLIPAPLLKAFVRLADSSPTMALRYGKVAVTAMGMFAKEPLWFVPHGGTTVLATVGGIARRVVETEQGFESREHLCLTLSFDHDLVDGAPAARFSSDFREELASGRALAAAAAAIELGTTGLAPVGDENHA